MQARLGWLVAIAGAGAIALSATAQGSPKLAVGPDAGGYLCPDGRQLYVKSCYDELPDAGCGVVNMHLPSHNGYQRVTTEIRANLASSLAGCKIYPLAFRDGVVSLVLPKSAPPQQTAKAPAPTQAPKTSTTTVSRTAGDKVTITDGMAIGHKGVRSSLVRISPPGAATIVYVDEASRKATAQKDVVTIWYLAVYVDGKPPVAGAAATWTEDAVNCKQRSFGLIGYVFVDRQATVLSAATGDVRGTVTKGSVSEAAADIACKPAQPFTGPRFASASAAIADAFAGAAPNAAAKSATSAAKPVAVALPAKAPIRLPETEVEKKVFEFIKSNQLQAAVNAIVKSPGGKLPTLTELTDEQGMTAVHWAAANRNAAAMRWLLDKGSEFDLADQKGRTPLKIALDNKDKSVMTLLLARGAYAQFAWPGHADELKGFKKTDELVDFLIKNAAPAAATTKPNAAAQARLDLLEEADRHFVNDDFERAIPLYERALELDPKDVKTAEQICTLYFLYVEAAEKGVIACERLLKLNPKDLAMPHSAIARLQQKRGDNRKALVSALEWARLAPAKSYAWTTLADIYVALGRNQEALAAVQKAVTLEPADWSHLAQRGDIFRRLGKFTESIADYRAGIAIWPEGPELHHDLSVVLRAAGRKTEADAEQRLAIEYALSNGRNALKKSANGSALSIGKIIAAKGYLEMLEKWDKSAAAKLAAEIKAAEQ